MRSSIFVVVQKYSRWYDEPDYSYPVSFTEKRLAERYLHLLTVFAGFTHEDRQTVSKWVDGRHYGDGYTIEWSIVEVPLVVKQSL